MPHETLRSSPIYQNALRAPDTMGYRQPMAYLTRREKNESRHGERCAILTHRLDHLIRNTMRDMGPAADGYLDAYIICAIKAFVKHIDATLPAMAPHVPTPLLNSVRQKVVFCREMMATSDHERTAAGLAPVSPEWFEQTVTRYGGTMQDMVYHSHFWNLYDGTTRDGHARLAMSSGWGDANLCAFHNEMLYFWS